MTAEVDQLGGEIFFDFASTVDTGAHQKLVIILGSVFEMSKTKQKNPKCLFLIRIISEKFRWFLKLKLTGVGVRHFLMARWKVSQIQFKKCICLELTFLSKIYSQLALALSSELHHCSYNDPNYQNYKQNQICMLMRYFSQTNRAPNG